MNDPTAQEIVRFWQKVAYSENGCWIWTGAHFTSGYGAAWVNKHRERAHRIMWEMFNGPVPVGRNVCHTCDNPPCVRPDHLFIGTQAENLADMTQKGRRRHFMGRPQTGELNHAAKLTAAQVADIRAMGIAGYSHRDIATRFNVQTATVTYILLNKTWKGVAPSAVLPSAPERIDYRPKLTRQQVTEIRTRYTGKRGELVVLASEYGVSSPAIRAVLKRQSYP